MGRFTLTVRIGPKVERIRFDDASSAVEALRARALRAREENPLGPIRAIRDYAPSDRVAARLEIRAPGLRGRTAGIDVRGDGSLVPYANAIRKRPLEARGDEEAFEALRAALA